MVFSDLFFLFVFIPAFMLLYMAAALADRNSVGVFGKGQNKAKNFVLVCFSLIFYAWGEPLYVFLMLVSVFFNFRFGLIIGKSRNHRRAALVGGLIFNILVICTFKYLVFFAQTLNDYAEQAH